MVTQELAARLWGYPPVGHIGDAMGSLAVTADGMAIDPSGENDFAASQLAKCDQVLRFIDRDWKSYRAAVAELRNELAELVTHR